MTVEYQIIGKYNGEEEVIDTCSDRDELKYALNEYRMAYGAGWTFRTKTVRK